MLHTLELADQLSELLSVIPDVPGKRLAETLPPVNGLDLLGSILPCSEG
jgi:hypothetical protein